MTLKFKELKNPRLLAAALRDASPDDIQIIIDHLTAIKEEIATRLAQENSRDKELKEKVTAMVNELKESNITIEDFMHYAGLTVKKRKMKMRYRYVGMDGITYEWTGQGRTPKQLLQIMQRDGTTKADYRISDEEAQ